MRLFADLLDPEGLVVADRWERYVTTGRAVGKCHCGLYLSGRPAESPDYSAVTYRDVVCPAGHEASLVGPYRGRSIPALPSIPDTTTSRREDTE